MRKRVVSPRCKGKKNVIASKDVALAPEMTIVAVVNTTTTVPASSSTAPKGPHHQPHLISFLITRPSYYIIRVYMYMFYKWSEPRSKEASTALQKLLLMEHVKPWVT
ncbi:hypothetical protein HAX54_036204 [Datura stramonium]|uniref:Uncharacterized protein n=1 Tax=Datura stramonium TaxID=4076 RepID=A0ABS8VHQ3_DATST|nr:hypothetical protein [Datura stramonium]